MSFYEQISKYYDAIFPAKQEQINLLMKVVGKPPKSVLDIACGTGGYALELANQGYQVTAVDLDAKMIEALNEKALSQTANLNAFKGNMLTLGEQLKLKYDLIYCIGNSLVHLDGEKEIGMFLKDMKSYIKEEGHLVIQIINYQRILNDHIQSLPIIENRALGLTFERNYQYNQDSAKIYFKTILKVEDQIIENEIPLYPIQPNQMLELLKQSGFNTINFYGDFKESAFVPNESYALVVIAS